MENFRTMGLTPAAGLLEAGAGAEADGLGAADDEAGAGAAEVAGAGAADVAGAAEVLAGAGAEVDGLEEQATMEPKIATRIIVLITRTRYLRFRIDNSSSFLYDSLLRFCINMLISSINRVI